MRRGSQSGISGLFSGWSTHAHINNKYEYNSTSYQRAVPRARTTTRVQRHRDNSFQILVGREPCLRDMLSGSVCFHSEIEVSKNIYINTVEGYLNFLICHFAILVRCGELCWIGVLTMLLNLHQLIHHQKHSLRLYGRYVGPLARRVNGFCRR